MACGPFISVTLAICDFRPTIKVKVSVLCLGALLWEIWKWLRLRVPQGYCDNSQHGSLTYDASSTSRGIFFTFWRTLWWDFSLPNVLQMIKSLFPFRDGRAVWFFPRFSDSWEIWFQWPVTLAQPRSHFTVLVELCQTHRWVVHREVTRRSPVWTSRLPRASVVLWRSVFLEVLFRPWFTSLLCPWLS